MVEVLLAWVILKNKVFIWAIKMMSKKKEMLMYKEIYSADQTWKSN